MVEPAGAHEYVVISRGQWRTDLPKEEIQTAIDKFYVWLEKMIAEGKMKTGQRLGPETRVVYGDGRITDGPFGETKEVIGGYWFVYGDTIDEAARLAGENPCLKCGLYSEIRPTDDERANVYVHMTESAELGGTAQ